MSEAPSVLESPGMRAHPRWVRISHWILAASVLTLAVSGVVILMAHPRLYWGEAGNDLMPALVELPIGPNYRHVEFEGRAPIRQDDAAGPVSASRTTDIFNQNGWGRSLHFLAAWFLVVPGLVYLLTGMFRGHFRAHIWPQSLELAPPLVWREVRDHARFRIRRRPDDPEYGLLQKFAYSFVVFVAAPLVVLTGLTMSPTVSAAFPFLLTLFGGFQSARTIHFIVAVLLVMFAIGHVVMVTRAGLVPHVPAMITGATPAPKEAA